MAGSSSVAMPSFTGMTAYMHPQDSHQQSVQGAPALPASDNGTALAADGRTKSHLPSAPAALASDGKRGMRYALMHLAPPGKQKDFSLNIKREVKDSLIDLSYQAWRNGRIPSPSTLEEVRDNFKSFLRQKAYTEGSREWQQCMGYFDKKLPTHEHLPFSDTIFTGMGSSSGGDFRRFVDDGVVTIRPEIRLRELDKYTASVKAFLQKQSWFHGARAVTSLKFVSVRSLHAHGQPEKLLVFHADVKFKDREDKKYCIPVRIDGAGNIPDKTVSDALKRAILTEAMNGRQLVRDAYPGHGQARDARRIGMPLKDLLQRRVESIKAKVEADRAAKATVAELKALEQAIKGTAVNKWTSLRKYTTSGKFDYVAKQIREFSPKNADTLILSFFSALQQACDAQPEEIKAYRKQLADEPKFKPTFYGYADFMCVPDRDAGGDFGTLSVALDTIQNKFGFSSLQLMPYVESPGIDGNYDISDHKK